MCGTLCFLSGTVVNFHCVELFFIFIKYFVKITTFSKKYQCYFISLYRI
jgi:hypothetical protein